MSETDTEELDAFKAYVIERSRCPSETPSARQRALMACLVIPASIQKWMLEVGAVDPLLDSLEKTILAAEKYAREDSATERGYPCITSSTPAQASELECSDPSAPTKQQPPQ